MNVVDPVSTILIVDENPVNVRLLYQALKGLGRFLFALSGHDALVIVRNEAVDLVLLDINMPGMSGYEICEGIHEFAEEIPVVFVTSHHDPNEEVRALKAGGSDFVQKPFNPLVIRARLLAYLRAKNQADTLRSLLRQDPLTEIANRRFLDEQCLRQWQHLSAENQPLSVLMIDIDYFKRYNDHYGHPKGDRCLQIVAKTIRDAVRYPSSVVARYGGEEFSVLLPRCGSQEAFRVAERICESVRKLREPHEDSEASAYVSVSIGCATVVPDSLKELVLTSPNPGLGVAADLFSTADKALYLAKQQGRNRALSHSP